MRKHTIVILIVMLVCGLALASSVLAASPVQNYAISWWTIANGGAMFSAGGDYTLGATIGQPNVGTMSGGNYLVSGGFWQQSLTGGPQHYIYLPLILRAL